MGATQRFQRQAFGQATGIRDLQSIRKKHHLHAGIAGVVAMSDRVDDPLETFKGDSDGVRADGAVS
jgi:hypothetical protein